MLVSCIGNDTASGSNLETQAEDAPVLVQSAQKRLGKAAASGVIHKNQAARRTSRMMKRAHAATTD